MIKEYGIFLIFFCASLILSMVIFVISYFFSYKQVDVEKISAYECGFDPFEDTRKRFDVRFYLVAISFIVFDLEVMYLFPWAVCIELMRFSNYISMFFFLVFITFGFVYEWLIGALDWE